MTDNTIYSKLTEGDGGKTKCEGCRPRCPHSFIFYVLISSGCVTGSGLFMALWTVLHTNRDNLPHKESTPLVILGISVAVFGVLCAVVAIAVWLKKRHRLKKKIKISVIGRSYETTRREPEEELFSL